MNSYIARRNTEEYCRWTKNPTFEAITREHLFRLISSYSANGHSNILFSAKNHLTEQDIVEFIALGYKVEIPSKENGLTQCSISW